MAMAASHARKHARSSGRQNIPAAPAMLQSMNARNMAPTARSNMSVPKNATSTTAPKPKAVNPVRKVLSTAKEGSYTPAQAAPIPTSPATTDVKTMHACARMAKNSALIPKH